MPSQPFNGYQQMQSAQPINGRVDVTGIEAVELASQALGRAICVRGWCH